MSQLQAQPTAVRTPSGDIIAPSTGEILWEDPTHRSPTIELLLEEGFQLSQEIRALYDRMHRVKSEVIHIAREQNPFGRKSVRIEARDLEAVVSFKDERLYNPEGMLEVRTLLGENRFIELFREKIEYRANFHRLRSFMSTLSTSESDNEAKALIGRLEMVSTGLPYVKFARKEGKKEAFMNQANTEGDWESYQGRG